MNQSWETGRAREASELVKLKRAAQVGRLMLGELNRPMEAIREQDLLSQPRKELQRQVHAARESLRKELDKFCRSNFENLNPEDLARLYEPLAEHGSSLRLPLTRFIKEYGQPRDGVLKGAPLHATLSISPWGLQTEYPEMQLVADLAEAVNNVIEGRKLFTGREGISWAKAKEPDTKTEIAQILRAQKFNCRMVVLSAFNLVEAYINGIAWEYAQTHDLSLMSERRRNLLTEESRPVNLIDKLVKVPRIVAERDEAPLHETQDPLKTFVEVVKPFRDAVVHASPFEAPERFGGYDKLSRLYDLTVDTALQTVGITLEIISAIHRFVDGKGDMPHWMPSRDPEGRFLVER